MPEWHIEYFDEISSTQDLARDRVRAGGSEGIVIIAGAQTAGRGRNGNRWDTFAGNLFASIVLRSPDDTARIGQYSFLVAVALRRALSQYPDEGHPVLNKWPNDILIDGKKVAGILLEVSGDSLIAGIGVNIASAPAGKICLHDVSRKRIKSRDLLTAILAHLDAVLHEYNRDGFDPLREEWIKHAANLHQRITARLPASTLEGIFEGLNADGALRLRLANGELKVIHSGEVFFG
jgi:BirA family biotin operon repressor/biotin-[acetyl-CoA-carboxylase] ligase